MKKYDIDFIALKNENGILKLSKTSKLGEETGNYEFDSINKPKYWMFRPVFNISMTICSLSQKQEEKIKDV